VDQGSKPSSLPTHGLLASAEATAVMPNRTTSLRSSLTQFIRQTARLKSGLATLIEQFREDDVEEGKRIFGPRFLTTTWRIEEGPYGLKETRTIAWINEYLQYLDNLAEFIVYDMAKPDLFGQLPLNGRWQFSADEYVRRLALQEAALKRIHAELAPARTPKTHDPVDTLLNRLRGLEKKSGVKEIASESGVNRDTINDMLSGRTSRPQKKTMRKLEEYLNRS
jgi:hypothetical protein